MQSLCKPRLNISEKMKNLPGLGNEIMTRVHSIKVGIQTEGKMTQEQSPRIDRGAEIPSDLSLLLLVKRASKEWRIPRGDISKVCYTKTLILQTELGLNMLSLNACSLWKCQKIPPTFC